MAEPVAVITGAASGIGRACAERLVSLGYYCVQVDRTSVDALAPGRGDAVIGDVRNAETASRAARAALAAGRPEILVNAAGVTGPAGPVETLAATDIEAVLNINITGSALMMGALLPHLHAGASVVNLSSAIGLVGGRGQAVYAASKHAVVGLTKSVALDVAARGIRVNCVCPGIVETPMSAAAGVDDEVRNQWAAAHPIGRYAQPSEIAAVVSWLCSAQASFITGAAIPVDGGYVAA